MRLLNLVLEKDKKGYYKLESILDVETGEIVTIDQIISDIGKIYVQNLNIGFCQIIAELKKLHYKNVYVAEKKGQYSFTYSNGQCHDIRIYSDHLVRLCNYSTKFMQDFNQDNAIKLIDYAESKNRTSGSLGADAFNEWLQTRFKAHNQTININACRILFREDYPLIHNPIVDRAKDMTSGYQLAKKGYYNNLYHYDIVSSYPSQLLNDTPVGQPRHYDKLEDVPVSYFYIVKFTVVDPVIKIGCIDFLNVTKSIHTYVLTSHLYKLFKENYKYSSINIREIIAFKTKQNAFKEFVTKNIVYGKINEKERCIAKYNKAIVNAIVGYMGKRNTVSRSKFVGQDIVYKTDPSDPIYLPIYLYVTGKAKSEFIRDLQRVGISNVVYANTDGFLCTKELDLNRLNIGRQLIIGHYKYKCQYQDIYIECINGYAGLTTDGEIDNTLSGIRLVSPISVREYQSKRFTYRLSEIHNCQIRETIISR